MNHTTTADHHHATPVWQGIPTPKFAIWLFLASEIITFGGLIFGKGPGDPAAGPLPSDPTETFALGINMPARAVVIGKLSKFTGEHHEFLTPGEYTQLTGRAGRRGIDGVGYAIVCWSPFVPFDQVAGLASRTEGWVAGLQLAAPPVAGGGT